MSGHKPYELVNVLSEAESSSLAGEQSRSRRVNFPTSSLSRRGPALWDRLLDPFKSACEVTRLPSNANAADVGDIWLLEVSSFQATDAACLDRQA